MTEQSKWASAGPANSIFVACAGLLAGGWLLGYLKPEVALVFGVFSMLICPVYTYVAVMMLKSGDHFTGNMFYVFGAIFFGVAGTVNVISYFAALQGWPMDPKAMGPIWLVMALFMLAVTWVYRVAPAAFFLLCVAASIGMLALGLLTMGWGDPLVLGRISGWAFLVMGFVSLYCGLATYLAPVAPPLGPVLFASQRTGVQDSALAEADQAAR